MTIPDPVDGGRPEPVLDAAKVAAAVSGLVTAIGAALVLIGWTTPDQVEQWSVVGGGIVLAVAAVLAVVMPLATAWQARGKVTPLADPRDSSGAPLAPAVDPPGQHAADHPDRL